MSATLPSGEPCHSAIRAAKADYGRSPDEDHNAALAPLLDRQPLLLLPILGDHLLGDGHEDRSRRSSSLGPVAADELVKDPLDCTGLRGRKAVGVAELRPDRPLENGTRLQSGRVGRLQPRVLDSRRWLIGIGAPPVPTDGAHDRRHSTVVIDGQQLVITKEQTLGGIDLLTEVGRADQRPSAVPSAGHCP